MSGAEGIRNFKRIPVKLEAEIISDGTHYSGFIENVSVSGLNFTAFTSECVTSFIPRKEFKLTFKYSGETITLNCEIKRVEINSQPTQDLNYTIALGITDPPPEYWKLLKSLK